MYVQYALIEIPVLRSSFCHLALIFSDAEQMR